MNMTKDLVEALRYYLQQDLEMIEDTFLQGVEFSPAYQVLEKYKSYIELMDYLTEE